MKLLWENTPKFNHAHDLPRGNWRRTDGHKQIRDSGYRHSSAA